MSWVTVFVVQVHEHCIGPGSAPEVEVLSVHRRPTRKFPDVQDVDWVASALRPEPGVLQGISDPLVFKQRLLNFLTTSLFLSTSFTLTSTLKLSVYSTSVL